MKKSTIESIVEQFSKEDQAEIKRHDMIQKAILVGSPIAGGLLGLANCVLNDYPLPADVMISVLGVNVGLYSGMFITGLYHYIARAVSIPYKNYDNKLRTDLDGVLYL